jgi:hypothetical protein
VRKLMVQIGDCDSKNKWTLIPLLLIVAFLTACASYAPAPQTNESDAASGNKPPMIIHNPDGTFTIQKEPPKGEDENAKAKQGLVIPPQVVVPIARIPQKQN